MLFSNNYKELFKKVYNEDLAPAQYAKLLEKELPPVCAEMNIGKILISADLPASFCEREYKITKHVLFEKKDLQASEPLTTEFTTTAKGKVTLTCFPATTMSYTKEEESDIAFFQQQLFVLFSRSRISKLLVKATETDVLTGALNTAGIRHLGELIMQKRLISKFSVIYLNIKNFRKINEIVTSKNGDIILQQYVGKITKFLGKDGAIGRLGGDNFAVLIKNSRLGDFLKFVEEIKITVDVDGAKKTAIIKVKSGICQGNPKVPVFDALLGCASLAYKVAKENPAVEYMVYTPEMGMPKPKKIVYM